MKEYRVVITKLGLTNRNTIMEEILNNHAKQGWVLHTAT